MESVNQDSFDVPGWDQVCKAERHRSNADFRAAIDLATEAIRLLPLQSPPEAVAYAYICRGAAHGQSGNHVQAIDDFNQSLHFAPSHFLAFYNRGYSLEQLGDYESAIEDYTLAIIQNPNDFGCYLRRGVALKRMGRREESHADFAIVRRMRGMGRPGDSAT